MNMEEKNIKDICSYYDKCPTKEIEFLCPCRNLKYTEIIKEEENN
jgi:hypothetical protein